MPRAFNVTAPAGTVRLDKNGQGEVTYTVTNDSDRPQRSLARIVPLEGAKQEWFTVAGDLERDLPVQGTQQYLVRIAVPRGTPAGLCKVRLDAVSAIKDADVFTEGPTVVFEVPKPEVKKNPLPWIIAGAALLLIVVVVILFIALQPKVPNIVGKSVEDARAALDKKKLHLKIASPTYKPGYEDNTVVTQSPAAGAKPPSDDSVEVSLNTLTVKVPRLAGLDMVSATISLLDLSLNPRIQSQQSNQTPLTVVTTNPAAETMAHRGDSITVVLATPPPAVVWNTPIWMNYMRTRAVSRLRPDQVEQVRRALDQARGIYNRRITPP